MPWQARDAKEHDSRANTKRKQKIWAEIANQQLKEHGDEGRAIRIANHAISQIGKADKEPYGDVEYADPGYQSDKKKRYPINTEEHIRAAWNYINKERDSNEYTSEQLSKIKHKIINAWKRKIDSEGPPSAEKALLKNLYVVNTLVGAFQDLRVAQRDLLLESGGEEDSEDRKFAERLAVVARDLSGVIGDKSRHEGREAVELSDVDDSILDGLLKSVVRLQNNLFIL